MGCLADLVGRTLTCDASDGKVYLGELGITSKEVEDYLSADNISAEAFLAERISMAERAVSAEVMSHYANRIVPHTFVDRARIGQPDDDQEVLTPTADTANGIILEVSAGWSNVQIEVSRLEVWQDASSVNVTFHDLTDGTLLHTEPVTLTSGKITAKEVSISLSIRRRTLTRILVSTTATSYYKTTMTSGGCTRCGSGRFAQGMLQAYGASIDSTLATYSYGDITRITNTGGISLIATIVCDHKGWLCEIKESFSLPMAYKVASEIMAYGANNHDRFNARVGQNTDAIKDRANYFEGKYRDAMDNLMKNMPLPDDEVCFECRKSVRQTIAIP